MPKFDKRAGKLYFYFFIIGIAAGAGSIAFHFICQLGIHFFLDFMAGYRPPVPHGEHHLFSPTSTPFNRWILLFLPSLGGLVSGFIVYTFAPEAEGHGTDAAINAYHQKAGFIRSRVPIIKTIASAITLTTGGSGGVEGPITQIGAGVGSFFATKFKLSDSERRIMLAAGLGAGLGSIFRVPLAGALFAAEVLYRDPDFESEVIIPAGISSVVAYSLFSLVFGWQSLFDAPTSFKFENPLELGPYAVLAGVLVLVGIFYIKSFYGVTDFFGKMKKIPNHFKPMIGGLLTGIIGFFLPHTLVFSYGFVQQAIHGKVTILFLLSLAIGKIITTSFSIGSGGSGGVFGPSVVIGGAVGGVVGGIFHSIMPNIVHDPGAFVIVGMVGFLTVVLNIPICSIIIVGEMTNSYNLLLPSLMVCSISYILSQKWTLYRKQVKSRLDSPAHAGDFFVDILQKIKVKDLMDKIKKVDIVPEDMPFLKFKEVFSKTKQHYFPVYDKNGDLSGIFSSTDIRSVIFSKHIEDIVVMRDIAIRDIIVTTPSEDLNLVLKKFTIKNIDGLPVVADDNPKKILGMLNRREVIAFYNEKVAEMKK